MKRWLGVLMLLALLVFAATPAFADDGRNDHVCFGGSTLVRADETPRSVVLFGCGARVLSGARVAQDIVSFGGDVVLETETHVGHDIVVFGGDVQVAGRVDHEIVAFGGRVTLESTAVVEQDVLVLGGWVDQKEGAIVRGKIERNTDMPRVRIGPTFFVPFRFGGWEGWDGFLSGIFLYFLTAVGFAALGVLILVFLPAQVKQIGEVAEQSALPSLGVGCLTWLVVPPLIVLFIITCLGIPLSMILGILLVAAAVLGWIALSVVVGNRLLDALKAQTIAPIVAMLVGLLVLWLITAIPLLGELIRLFALALAVGAVVLTRFGTQPYPLPSAPVAAAPTTVAPVESPSTPAAVDASATPSEAASEQ